MSRRERVIRDDPAEPFRVVEIDGEVFEEGEPVTSTDEMAQPDAPEGVLDFGRKDDKPEG